MRNVWFGQYSVWFFFLFYSIYIFQFSIQIYKIVNINKRVIKV